MAPVTIATQREPLFALPAASVRLTGASMSLFVESSAIDLGAPRQAGSLAHLWQVRRHDLGEAL